MFVCLSAVIKIVQKIYIPFPQEKNLTKSPVIMFSKIQGGACVDKNNGFKINYSSLYG